AGDTQRAVLLAAAAASLRDIAGLPPLPPARIARYLSAAGIPADARSAGSADAARSAAPVGTAPPTDPDALWSRGRALTPEAAITLALTPPPAISNPSAIPHAPVSPQPSPALPPNPASPGSTPPSRPGQIPDISGTGREVIPLTPREMEIAALVASGRSNKAIAGELFISPATVARHIANIMHKLGFSTRTQIATWTLTRDS
ncbi:MAG: LuxR C-terminal-related transcriptional regulator, partial [Trebonia sp.]